MATVRNDFGWLKEKSSLGIVSCSLAVGLLASIVVAKGKEINVKGTGYEFDCMIEASVPTNDGNDRTCRTGVKMIFA